MARIKTYTVDTLITDNDIVIGSDSDNLSQTKNYKASDLRGYVLSGLDPETGGNLKITTITATSSVYLTPNGYVNNLNPAIEVLSYEIIFLILNGRTYIFRRNGDTFGVGETQTSSGDFTEIDITSVINANLQDLDSVLSEGNVSQEDAKIGALFLYDEMNANYGKIFTDKDTFILKDRLSNNILEVGGGYITLRHNNSTNDKFSIQKPIGLTTARTATFQNASGTVAYLSDIPTVEIQELADGDNISIESSDGVYTINSNYYNRPYITDIQFRNSLTNTTFFTGGQNYTYNAVSSPINSIRIKFNESIFKVTTSNVKVASILIDFEKDSETPKNKTEIFNTNVTLSGDYITFPFDFSTFSNTVGLRPINIKVSLYPDVITNGVEKCDGTISESISNFLNDALF
jgi:hypothetical protein